MVREYIRNCSICQRNQYENIVGLGTLQPLPIPQGLFTDTTMDFIEGLPKSHNKLVIFVVVDRFTKFAHFIPLSHPYSTKSIA